LERNHGSRRSRVDATLGEHLRRRGLRWSSTRDAVVDAFLGAPHHVSVDELLARVRRREPGVGHATVYRTLRLLEETGLATSHQFGDGPTRYEPSAGTRHHDHLVCTGCGVIVEFEEPEIERLQDEVARDRGFVTESHRLELYGRCPTCRDRASAGGRS
jgi:Fur family transcriptional regulator, ferric uptake regulator